MNDEAETSVLDYSSTFIIEPWDVILINDDWHCFDDVIMQLIWATKCTPQKASEIAWEAHDTGESICYTSSKEHREHVASILEEIELCARIERMV